VQFVTFSGRWPVAPGRVAIVKSLMGRVILSDAVSRAIVLFIT
jgi:hypothetical protein